MYINDLCLSCPDMLLLGKVIQQVASHLNFLGMQHAVKKIQDMTQKPGPWAGSMVDTSDGVYLLTMQEKWDKTWKILKALKEQVDKYGIKVPRSVAHAYELDQKNGDTFWRDAIKNEMMNVFVAFEILNHGEDAPRNFKELGVHLRFDIKMDMTRKAQLVADGHKVADPQGSTYAGVVL